MQILVQTIVEVVLLEVEMVRRDRSKCSITYLGNSKFLSIKLNMEILALISQNLSSMKIQSLRMYTYNPLPYNKWSTLTFLDHFKYFFKLLLTQSRFILKPRKLPWLHNLIPLLHILNNFPKSQSIFLKRPFLLFNKILRKSSGFSERSSNERPFCFC